MTTPKVLAEIDELFHDLDQLLKNADVEAALSAKGVNTSLAIVAADGLRAYLHGEKAKAVEELGTAVEEIEARMEAARTMAKGKPS
jgi:hypothetical protein